MVIWPNPPTSYFHRSQWEQFLHFIKVLRSAIISTLQRAELFKVFFAVLKQEWFESHDREALAGDEGIQEDSLPGSRTWCLPCKERCHVT